MKKEISVLAIALAAITSSPALADEAAVETQAMIETAAPKTYQAVDIPVQSFDLAGVAKTKDFMATVTRGYKPNHRLQENNAGSYAENSAGPAALFVPEEFAYRSNAQDSGVDAVTPGRFVSQSVRTDYLSDTGTAAADKSSVGIRFGF